MSEEGRGRDGEMISLRRMKKNFEEEKKKVEEEKRMKEEEGKRADEEKKKREESEKGREEEKRRAEEEKREEEERRAGEMEVRIRNLEQELFFAKHPPITSLDGTSVTFTPSNDGIKREGNTIINTCNFIRNCFIGGEMRSV